MSSRGTISFVKYSLRKEYVRSIFLVTRLCLFSFFFHSECIHVTCLAWEASSSPSICGGAHFTIPLRSPFAGFGCFLFSVFPFSCHHHWVWHITTTFILAFVSEDSIPAFLLSVQIIRVSSTVHL